MTKKRLLITESNKGSNEKNISKKFSQNKNLKSLFFKVDFWLALFITMIETQNYWYQNWIVKSKKW